MQGNPFLSALRENVASKNPFPHRGSSLRLVTPAGALPCRTNWERCEWLSWVDKTR
jgi:hypothetical protein